MEEDLKSASDGLREDDHPAYQPRPAKPDRNFPKILIVIFVVIVLLAAAGLAVWKLVLNKPKTAPPSSASTAQVTPKVKVGDDIANEALTETYNSTPLSISFKYPKSWKVSEANGGIRVESPTFNYLPAEAASLDGNFRIYIRQGSRTQDGKYIGRGQAIKASEKLTYTQPAVGQRVDTWLSSFGYDSQKIFSFFLIAGNFELKQGDTLGPDYGKEPDAYIVAGGYSGPNATDDLAMNSVSLDYYATTNAYKQALQIIASLQLK